MQLIQLDLSHDNFFCPVTGQRITGSEIYEPSPALAGVWHSEALDMPELYHSELESRWESYAGKILEADDFIDLADFLNSTTMGNLVCFEITTCGISCGPTASTLWYVIDMDYDPDEAIDQ